VPAVIRLVDELPRTTVGKIDRLALRERLAAQGQSGERIQKAL
jgi:acyl-coenzyme A synthetase/AMP-(fatty) acid ligase